MKSVVFARHLGLGAALVVFGLRSGPAQELLHSLDVDSIHFSRQIAFSDDDRLLATLGGSHDGNVIVWDVATGRQLASLPNDAGMYRRDAMTFVPGQPTVALINQSKQEGITLWDFERNRKRELPIEDGAERDDARFDPLTFAPDGRFLAVQAAVRTRSRGEKRFVRVIRTDDGSLVANLELRGIGRRFHFSGDGSTLFVADQLYRPRARQLAVYVHQWDLHGGEKINEWGPFPSAGVAPDGWVVSGRAELSTDGRLLATKVGNRVAVIDVSSGAFLNTGAHRAVAFDPRGYFMAGGEINEGRVTLWPLDGSRSYEHLDQPGIAMIHTVKYSPSGALLAVAGRTDLGSLGNRLLLWRVGEQSDGQ